MTDTTKQKWSRNCPECNRTVHYKNKVDVNRANKSLLVCKSCAGKKKVVSNETKIKIRQNHAKYMLGKTHSIEARQKISIGNKGKTISNEHKNTIRNAQLGRHHSDETKQKLSIIHTGRIKSPLSNVTRQKLKLAFAKRKQQHTGRFTPSYNKVACNIFNEINSTLGWNGQHAENGGEFMVIGYFVDFYEPTLNIVVEYDEPKHNIYGQKIKDIIRQKEITEHLQCKFYRITPDQNWKEILCEFV